jgi:hypothetical protein
MFMVWPRGPELLQNFLSHLEQFKAFLSVHHGKRLERDDTG